MVGVPSTVMFFTLLSALHLDRSPRAAEMIFHQSDSSFGAVEGFVRLAGEETPSPTLVENATDPDVCGREHSLEDFVVSPLNRGIRYVIATLADVLEDRVPERLPKRLVLDNRDCRFDPHVSAVAVGDTIVATNGDPILHNTHLYGALRSNIALPVGGLIVSRVARLPGMITVLCDVHGWMKAFIRVDEHPYHAVTNEHGHFRISGIPPGGYTLELWHEKLGTRQVRVRIEPGTTSRIELEYALVPDKPSSQ